MGPQKQHDAEMLLAMGAICTHPERLGIAQLLANAPGYCATFMTVFDKLDLTSRAKLTFQARVLRRAGLITARKCRRPSNIKFSPGFTKHHTVFRLTAVGLAAVNTVDTITQKKEEVSGYEKPNAIAGKCDGAGGRKHFVRLSHPERSACTSTARASTRALAQKSEA